MPGSHRPSGTRGEPGGETITPYPSYATAGSGQGVNFITGAEQPEGPQWKWTGLVGYDDRRRPTQALSNVTVTGSALGYAIPHIYGTAKVSGQLIMAHKPSTGPGSSYIHCAYVLAEGGGTVASPNLTLATFKVNDEALPLTNAAWAYGFNSAWAATPADASNVSTFEVYNGATNQGIHTGLQSLTSVNWNSMLPGTAWCYVRIDPTQAPGGIPQLTCVITRADITDWDVDAPAALHSHNPVVALWDFMHTVMGVANTEIDETSWDAAYTWCETQGYTINIALQASSTLDAIDTIRQHGMLFRPYWWDGHWYLGHRGSLAAADLTLTDDDLVTSPTWQTTPFTERPNHVCVFYTDATTYEQLSESSEAASVALKDRRSVEVTLTGCTNATMAFRWAETYRKLLAMEYQRIRFTAGPAAITAAPGCRIDLTSKTWGNTSKTLRCMAVTYRPDQTVDIECVNYNVLAISGSTKVGDSISTRLLNFKSDTSNITTVTYTFRYIGDSTCILAADHNDLTGWDTTSNVTITANDANPPSGGLLGAAGTADKVTADAANAYIGGPDDAPGISASSYSCAWLKAAATLTVAIGDNDDWAASERDVSVKTWWRWYPARRDDPRATGAEFRVKLYTLGDAVHVTGAGALGYDDVAVKTFEELTWTAPADTSGIDRVALLYQNSSSGPWIEHCSADVGAAHLTWGTSSEAMAPPLPQTWFDWKLVVVSTSGAVMDAPVPGTSTYTYRSNFQRYVPQLRIGDPANYADFNNAGQFSLSGTAKYWGEENLPLKTWSLGGTPPAEDVLDKFYALRFDRATEESVYYVWKVPESYEDASDIELIIDFAVENPPVAPSANEVVKWGLQNKKISEGAVFDFDAGTNTNVATETLVADETALIIHRCTLELTDAGFVSGDLVLLRLYRDADDGADTYDNEASNDDNDAWLVNATIRWEANTLGAAAT